MENEKIKAILNNMLIMKLDSIALDIKYYINTNTSIAYLDDENVFIDNEDIDEMLGIRHRIKRLAYNLKNKLNVIEQKTSLSPKTDKEQCNCGCVSSKY